MQSSAYSPIYPAGVIQADPHLLPERPGVYFLMIDDPSALAGAVARVDALMLDSSTAEKWALAGVSAASEVLRLGKRPVLYIGASERSLRQRIVDHVRGDSRRSNFRQHLGALLSEELSLEGYRTSGKWYIGFGAGEAKLTGWIAKHVSIAYRSVDEPVREERNLIEWVAPLLNVEFQEDRFMTLPLRYFRRECARDARPPAGKDGVPLLTG